MADEGTIGGKRRRSDELVCSKFTRVCLLYYAQIMFFQHALVLLQLCNQQGKSQNPLFRFEKLPPVAFRHLYANERLLTNLERLRIGCGNIVTLVKRFSRGTGCCVVPNRKICDKQMYFVLMRIAAKRAAAVVNKAIQQAKALCASGECAAAIPHLKRAIAFGDLPSRAKLADMFIDGRPGVPADHAAAFALVNDVKRLKNSDCLGVLARCYLAGIGCNRDRPQANAHARASADACSSYGQFVCGNLCLQGGIMPRFDSAIIYFQLAAAQEYDEAMNALANMMMGGYGVPHNIAEARRLYTSAAKQGLPAACYNLSRLPRLL
jgi:TPR repeat protein